MYSKTSGTKAHKKVTDIFEILFWSLTNVQYNCVFNQLAASDSMSEKKQYGKIKLPPIDLMYVDKILLPIPKGSPKLLPPIIKGLPIGEVQYIKMIKKMKACGLVIPARAGYVSLNIPLLKKIQGSLKKNRGKIATEDVQIFVDPKPPKPKKTIPEKDRLKMERDRLKVERIVASRK